MILNLKTYLRIRLISMIKIPRLSISYNSSSNVFKLDHDAISFPIKKLEFNNMEFFVIGRPYINFKRLSSTLRNINKIDSIPHELIRSINGEFLIVIYSKSSKKIALINDRFCSIPIYYAVTKNNFFHASINYFDISKKLREFGRIKYNKSAFYEFLWSDGFIMTLHLMNIQNIFFLHQF